MKFFDITNLNRHYVCEQMGWKFINLHIRNVLFFVSIKFLILEKRKMFKIIHIPKVI